MPAAAQSEPFPHDIWLKVAYTDDIPVANRDGVTKQLQALEGWSTSMTGADGGALRYAYYEDSETTVPERARKIMSQAGARDPQVSSFVVWRVDLKFRGSIHSSVFGLMARAMEQIPEVLDVHDLGNSHAGVYVEFRGEPSASVMSQIISLARPYMN